jgi:hypothetical protein
LVNLLKLSKWVFFSGQSSLQGLGDFSGQRKQGNHSSAEVEKLQKELNEGKMALK